MAIVPEDSEAKVFAFPVFLEFICILIPSLSHSKGVKTPRLEVDNSLSERLDSRQRDRDRSENGWK